MKVTVAFRLWYWVFPIKYTNKIPSWFAFYLHKGWKCVTEVDLRFEASFGWRYENAFSATMAAMPQTDCRPEKGVVLRGSSLQNDSEFSAPVSCKKDHYRTISSSMRLESVIWRGEGNSALNICSQDRHAFTRRRYRALFVSAILSWGQTR